MHDRQTRITRRDKYILYCMVTMQFEKPREVHGILLFRLFHAVVMCGSCISCPCYHALCYTWHTFLVYAACTPYCMPYTWKSMPCIPCVCCHTLLTAWPCKKTAWGRVILQHGRQKPLTVQQTICKQKCVWPCRNCMAGTNSSVGTKPLSRQYTVWAQQSPVGEKPLLRQFTVWYHA